MGLAKWFIDHTCVITFMYHRKKENKVSKPDSEHKFKTPMTTRRRLFPSRDSQGKRTGVQKDACPANKFYGTSGMRSSSVLRQRRDSDGNQSKATSTKSSLSDLHNHPGAIKDLRHVNDRIKDNYYSARILYDLGVLENQGINQCAPSTTTKKVHVNLRKPPEHTGLPNLGENIK